MGIYVKGATLSVELKEIFKELDIMDNLIEVKTPHGRLIDTDALARKIVESNYGVDFINKTTALIMNAPTVIEAEVE